MPKTQTLTIKSPNWSVPLRRRRHQHHCRAQILTSTNNAQLEAMNIVHLTRYQRSLKDAIEKVVKGDLGALLWTITRATEKDEKAGADALRASLLKTTEYM
ncbi:hypothetical protein ACQKWADRAFT_295962 [Trichoderma austrokoningii]